jgi:hypothetical protein
MLFILAIEPLHRMLDLATRDDLLTPINNRATKLRMYADDAAIFLNLVQREVHTIAQLLHFLGRLQDLSSIAVSAVYPIRCEDIDAAEIMQGFNCPIKGFLCTYLGLSLHFRVLHRVEIQPLIDKMSNRLSTWKGKFLNKVGRLKLLNTVLSSISTYFLTIFPLKKWAIKRMDKIRREFLWKGSENANGVV